MLDSIVGNFRRWDLAGDIRSFVICPGRLYLDLVSSHVFMSVSWLPYRRPANQHEVSNSDCLYTLVPRGNAQPWSMEKANHEPKQTVPSPINESISSAPGVTC